VCNVFGDVDAKKKEDKRELSLKTLDEFDKDMLFATM